MPKGSNSGPKLSLCHFCKFGPLVFLQITYNYSLQQCLTSNTDKIITHKKNWGPNLGQN